MKKHEILSPQSRATLFDPPIAPAAIVRHYTFSPEDMMLVRERRRAANRLGFAVQLAYFRHPGRIMRVDEEPPVDMLAFIARQVHAGVDDFRDYAGRAQTRREHLADLQACLNIRLARRAEARPLVSVALNEAIGSDRGAAIVLAMIDSMPRLMPGSRFLFGLPGSDGSGHSGVPEGALALQACSGVPTASRPSMPTTQVGFVASRC